MELAVNIPEQEPQVGQLASSRRRSSASSIRPALYAPTASNIWERLVFFPSTHPASIGPPEQTIAGRFSRSAAISMPGTILSQFGISTKPSKQWAAARVSTESAISSRDAKE